MSRFIFQLYGGTELGMSPLQFSVMCTELLGDGVFMKGEAPDGKEEGEDGGDQSRMIKLIEHFIQISKLNEACGHGTHKSRRRSMHKSGHKSHKSHHHKSHHHGTHKEHKSHRHTNEEIDESESRDEVGEIETSSNMPDEYSCNLLKLMNEKSTDPIIKFKFFVKAERKLRGEGIYHAAVESQNAFRECVMGKEYWDKHIEGLNELVYGRDLWNIMDLYYFAVCGVAVPENYHDLNFEDVEEIRARKKSKLAIREAEKMLVNNAAHDEKSQGAEKSTMRRKRKKKRGEENYQYFHYGTNTSLNMHFIKDNGKRLPLGPGGLNPYLVLAEMPDSMRVAFEKHDMTMLRQLESGSDKKVTKEKFRIWIHKAEDAGLWESKHEVGEGGPVGSHGSNFTVK